MKTRKRLAIGCSVTLVVIAGLVIWLGPVVRAAYKVGLFSADVRRKYNGDRVQRLKALYVALMSYQKSEGQFPDGKTWMDDIKDRLFAADMDHSQSLKKLHDPALSDPNQYGWALNSAVAGKYIGDIKNPASTPLVFTSSDLSKNACGTPQKLLPHPPRGGENIAISVSGKIINF